MARYVALPRAKQTAMHKPLKASGEQVEYPESPDGVASIIEKIGILLLVWACEQQ
jgi:hypothetical protein